MAISYMTSDNKHPDGWAELTCQHPFCARLANVLAWIGL